MAMTMTGERGDISGQVLGALREAGAPVSGESLAASLGISRAAVWKQIQRLKALGYDIAGEPRRGYRLLAAPDRLYPHEILHRLGTRRWRGPVVYRTELPSTNDLAKSLGAQGASEGTLVVAEAQTAGRGRLGRDWLSPPGEGIYVSLILKPPLPPSELPQITLTVAVAVVRALRAAAGVSPGIKWPNDLILGGKKLGGILTEMETESDRIRYVVVGLGLNVNNPQFPPELSATATSLLRETGRRVPRAPLVRAWLEEFETLYDGFSAGNFPEILEEWRHHTVTLGRRVTVRHGNREFHGWAREVEADGALLLETEAGETIRVTSGEVAQE